MRRSRSAACCIAIALPVMAQQQAAELHNNGEPMRAAFTCASENLDWAGLACSDDDPCAIYLELNAIAAAGTRIFVVGDLHAQSATLASILLASDDGGGTWKEPAVRVRGASLDQIQLLGAENGWIGGETVNPLPRDPFFLITSDGGESWRNRAVTDEGGPGSIQRFVFQSADHGEALIDAGAGAEGARYRQYETNTSGDGWNLRAATMSAPKMAAVPPADSEYRLTAGKNAWLIERRTAGKWTAVASFTVLAATCKSETPGETPAPAEPADSPAPKDRN